MHTPLGITPKDYYLTTIQLPKSKIVEIEIKRLPKNWNTFPHLKSTKKFGDDFVKKNSSLILKVPSAVIQDEFNYLINPFHKEFAKVKIKSTKLFKFDSRLFKK